MKVTYIGQQPHDPAPRASVSLYGFTFPRGEAVEVPDSVGMRLRGNHHFRVGAALGKTVEAAGEQTKAAAKPRGRKTKAAVEVKAEA